MVFAEVLIVQFKFVSSLQAILSSGPLDIAARTSSKCGINTVVLVTPVGSVDYTWVYSLICLYRFLLVLCPTRNCIGRITHACVGNRSSIDYYCWYYYNYDNDEL